MPEKNLEGKKIVMVIAFRNFQDEEYFITNGILKESGAEIKTASSQKGIAIGASGGETNVDLLVKDLNPADFDGIVFIGGSGCLGALDNEESYRVIKETISQNKILASICISPVILAKSGVLEGKKATVWNSPFDRSPIEILENKGAIYQGESVIVDGKIITANGPPAAEEFGETIVGVLTKI